jgi:hypothetical protein
MLTQLSVEQFRALLHASDRTFHQPNMIVLCRPYMGTLRCTIPFNEAVHHKFWLFRPALATHTWPKLNKLTMTLMVYCAATFAFLSPHFRWVSFFYHTQYDSNIRNTRCISRHNSKEHKPLWKPSTFSITAPHSIQMPKPTTEPVIWYSIFTVTSSIPPKPQ